MKRKLLIGGLITILGIALAVILIISNKDTYTSMSYNSFLEKIETLEVDEVNLKSDELMIVTLKDNSIYEVPNPQKDDLKEYLLINDVKVTNAKAQDTQGMVSSILIIGVIIGFVWYKRNGTTANKELIKDANKKHIKEEHLIKFDHVAGNHEAKEMVKDIIDFIKEPEKYEKTGAKMPKGILLYGSPGTGKTLLAKAIAGEANVPFYAMSGSDFVQMYVGVGANRVRQLFKKAKKSEKAVVFIDEIDALGKSRGKATSSANDEREQTLNALLTEMSGFNDSDGIVVIGATNRPDTLDEALLRPGRFDRQIEVSLPDKKAREEILSLYIKNKPIADDIDIEDIAVSTAMFSGAMLENLVNESAILAANDEKVIISKEHMDKAFYNVVAGMEKKDAVNLISDEEKMITAFHEAGHAIVAKLLLPTTQIAKVTIIPTTKGAAGYNYNIPEDKMYRKKHEILSRIKVLLAGRATEEIIFGEDNITTGAINDIKEASKELYNYFSKYGMDEDNGLFSLEINNALDEKIYDTCREKMKDLYFETKILITENKRSLDLVVEELITKETISGKDIDRVFRVA